MSAAKESLAQLDRLIAGDVRALDYGQLREVLVDLVGREDADPPTGPRIDELNKELLEVLQSRWDGAAAAISAQDGSIIVYVGGNEFMCVQITDHFFGDGL